MLKKRNIAMVMAAATVATSVAPVFAAVENQNVDEATLIAKVEEMLNTKYTNSKEDGDGDLTTQATGTNAYKNSVYQITATAATATPISEDVKSVSHLKELIEKVKVEKKVLTLAVVDKGHKIVDGSIEATEVNDRLTYAASADPAKGHVLLPSGAIGTVGTVDAGQTKITLANGNEIEIAIGQYAFDLTKPVDANGNVIDVNTTDAATQRRVVGFEMAVDTVNGKIERDLGSKAIVNLVFNNKDTKIEKELSNLITEDGYTEDGAEFVNTLLAAKVATNGSPLSVVKNGVRYNIGYATTTAVTAVKEGGYEFTVNLEAVKDGETLSGTTNIEITVKSDSQKDLADLKAYLDNKTAGTDDVVAGKITKLVGDTRFETAVEVSKEAYPTIAVSGAPTAAGAVVLVGENAIVDGLAAAPLAAQEDAPILLTKKDTVPTETMNEIKRLVQKGSDIYLIGGENTISKEVEAELVKEMNANIIRVSGDDRYATSLAIAEKITTPNSRAFVVGGEGLADAMSIAAIAADDTAAVSPIIVTPKEGLTKDAKSYIKDTATITSVDVIGGESNVSTDVLKDIADIKRSGVAFGAANIERVAGADRNDTNAKVIKKYFYTENTNTASLSNVYVAKDGNTQLIDALAVAPLAGKNQGAIVLATNDLTKAQNAAVKVSITGIKTLTQVGGGIASTVVSKLVELLGL